MTYAHFQTSHAVFATKVIPSNAFLTVTQENAYGLTLYFPALLVVGTLNAPQTCVAASEIVVTSSYVPKITIKDQESCLAVASLPESHSCDPNDSPACVTGYCGCTKKDDDDNCISGTCMRPSRLTDSDLHRSCD
jgi:hypothetical protein